MAIDGSNTMRLAGLLFCVAIILLARSVAFQAGADLPVVQSYIAVKEATNRVIPEFPNTTNADDRREVDVVVRIRTSVSGDVDDVSILRGQPPYSDAAVLAAKQWRFGSGKAISTWLGFHFGHVQDGSPQVAVTFPVRDVAAIPQDGLPHLVRVSSGVVSSNRIGGQNPQNVTSERGQVRLRVIINEEGQIELMQPLPFDGSPRLVLPTMEAVKDWRYKPYLLNGKPIKVDTVLVIDFE